MAVDWEVFALSLLLIVIGVIIGIVTHPIYEWLAIRSKRKKIAKVLSAEISTIRIYAKNSIDLHDKIRKLIESKDKKSESGELTIKTQWIEDVDFPTRLFQGIINEIGLLRFDIIIVLSDIYNQIDCAHHWKKINMKHMIEVNNLLYKKETMKLTDMEIVSLQLSSQSTKIFANSYRRSVEEIYSLSSEALKKLGKI